MTSAEAKKIAEEYVHEIGEVLPGFRLGVGDETEFTSKYYFDFIWLRLDGQRPVNPPVAGGARGFTVDKEDQKIELITYAVYGSLVHSEKERNSLYQMLIDFKNENKGLTEMKARFNLNSEQLLDLSKLIRNTELNKEKIYEIVNDLVAKVARDLK